MTPEKPLLEAVKEPIVAIVSFLFCCRAAPIAASMNVARTADDRTAPIRPECNGGRQVAFLLVGEEW